MDSTMINMIAVDELRFIAITDLCCESLRKDFDNETDYIAQFHLIDKAKQLQLPADFISQLEDDFKIGK